MRQEPAAPGPMIVASPSGLRAQINANGSVQRFDCDAITLSLFVGNEIEGGPTNLYLRRLGSAAPPATAPAEATPQWTALLGPTSPTAFHIDAASGALVGHGEWLGIRYSLALVLAKTARTWFWRARFENTNAMPCKLDLTYVQDVALASYGAIRLNEFYVSQYLDHTSLNHPTRGTMVASRQNLAVDGRIPWCLVGSLRRGVSFGTDAMQFHGLGTRAGVDPPGLLTDLPSRRLQQEHAMIVLRDATISLAAGESAAAGFFGAYVPDHAGATSAVDIALADAALTLPEATSGTPASSVGAAQPVNNTTLISSAVLLSCLDIDVAALRQLFPGPWRHEETDGRGTLLSFFDSGGSHIVLRAKELQVQRPHGHLLRTGRHLTPDETGLTSTAWMGGVFHSMVTQGHVSINRFLSTVHSYLGLFRSHGQRVFVELDGGWQLLDQPSVFEMSGPTCRWIYRHRGGEIQVRAAAAPNQHVLSLSITTTGGPLRFLVSHHIAMNGDDGSVPGPAIWKLDGDAIVVAAAPGGDVGNRFPQGTFRITAAAGTELQQVGGDELLFVDGQSRRQPFVCLVTGPARAIGLTVVGNLVTESGSPAGSRGPAATASVEAPALLPDTPLALQLSFKAGSAGAATAEFSGLERLGDIAPWFAHNALVHYLSPRGLEQYSGGGWGTRDVCQGPVELLLALGKIEPIRDLLLRVMANQNPDGDWPQWFMFFERERGIRPGDSHGDIVFWPLLVLAQYLIASGDAGVLDERVPFFDSRGTDAGESATVLQHAQRALTLIEKRVLPGTALAAYGHGDWNDSLQPADPGMRDRMCSSWTVTLHFQTLTTLAVAMRGIGCAGEADRLEKWAAAVKRDFQRLLMPDAVLAGYVVHETSGTFRYLLHPQDQVTGIRYSALAMIHAILEDLVSPEQARTHLQLIDTHLTGPDGIRLFDRPMPYRGGPQSLFQRAETATYFGREIGLMYVHAHLRFAQALAHMGEADRFFRALCQANPIGIRSIVPTATLRQSNCYYSSSDAAFADRYQASAEYERIAHGAIALDGGWRVYSSGAGIALGLVVRRFLGLGCESQALRVDPVMPLALDGLEVNMSLLGRAFRVKYRIAGTGCGVHEITLNGQNVSFTREANPYRSGAALVPMQAVLAAFIPGQNFLDVAVG